MMYNQVLLLFFGLAFVFKLTDSATQSECLELIGTPHFTNCTLSPNNYPVVEMKAGKVGGFCSYSEVAGREICSFKGCPYAKPPIGKLRFRNPQKPTHWTGIRWSFEHGSMCPQKISVNLTGGSEDCLYYNIYYPKNKCTSESRCPVMIHFHGGAFYSGSGSSVLYGPDRLMRENVILVTYNFRLEALGFSNTGDQNIQGNAGLMDQVMMMLHVKENIAAFNGERGLVTIFGDGASLCNHCFAEFTKGLFHRVILQSGSCLSGWSFQPNPGEVIKELASNLNLTYTGTPDLTNKLRTASVEDLLTAGSTMRFKAQQPIRNLKSFKHVPAPDDFMPHFTAMHPRKFMESNLEGVPVCHNAAIMTGTVLNEGGFHKSSLILNPNLLSDIKANKEILIPIKCEVRKGSPESKFLGDKIYNHHFNTGLTEMNFFKYTTLMVFLDGNYAFAKYNLQKEILPYIYLYRFCSETNYGRRSFFPDTPCADIGPIFTDDWPVTFTQTDVSPNLKQFSDNVKVIPFANRTDDDKRVASQITRLFVNFAKTGNPTPCPDDPIVKIRWSPNTDSTNIQVFNIDTNVSMGPHPQQEDIAFWDTLC